MSMIEYLILKNILTFSGMIMLLNMQKRVSIF